MCNADPETTFKPLVVHTKRFVTSVVVWQPLPFVQALAISNQLLCVRQWCINTWHAWLAGSPEAAGIARRGVDEPGGYIESLGKDTYERATQNATVCQKRVNGVLKLAGSPKLCLRVCCLFSISHQYPAMKKLFWGVTAMEAFLFLPLLLTVPKFNV